MKEWMIFKEGDQVMVREESRRSFDSDFGISELLSGKSSKSHPGTGIFIVERVSFHDAESVRTEGFHPQCIVVSQGDFTSKYRSGCIFIKVLPPGEDETSVKLDPLDSTPVVITNGDGIFII